MDLTFHVEARWVGVGAQGEGDMALGGQILHYSAPSSMGGKGVGTSPEELLLAAVTSCYSGTLARVLQERGLPRKLIDIRTEGNIEDYPRAARYRRITVHPSIRGGDPARLDEYYQAALEARERCFIGKTIRTNVEYEVGEVTVNV